MDEGVGEEGKMKQITIVCMSCGIEQPLSEFPNGTAISGKNEKLRPCRACNTAKVRAWRARNPELYKAQQRRSRLIRRFGITPEEYDALFEKQDGHCAICGNPPNGDRLAIDHNHSNGKVRSLLCHKCNTVLGLVNEDTNILHKLIEYIKGTVSSTETETVMS